MLPYLSVILQILLIVVLGFLLYKMLPAYATRKGENRADKEDAGKISYEQEHGRNLATKDDIDSVIKELEKVKSEVSLAEQRKHNLIEKRNESLLGIVEAAERMRIMKVQIASYISNLDAKNLSRLTDEISETLVSLRKNVQIVTALTSDEKELDALTIFSYDITSVGMEYIQITTNTISQIQSYELLLSRAEAAKTPAKSQQYCDKAYETYEYIHKIKEDLLKSSNKNWQKHEEIFMKFLNYSYRKGKLVG